MAKKTDKIINVTYHNNAKVKCLNCGSEYELGMTMESLTLEICANCHPFYTGQESLVDTAGRIEKFQNRLSKASNNIVKFKTKSKTRKIKGGDVTIDINPQLDPQALENVEIENIDSNDNTIENTNAELEVKTSN
jgi:large subunit ribosomal protein L31